jgi:iron(III) transport system substrate-binding protein
MATTESGPLAQAFEKKYGVKVQLWRALSENVLQRALTEARGGRRSMDVVETNAPEVEALARRAGWWRSSTVLISRPAALGIPPHRRWFSDRANLWVAGYNTGKVKREELPATGRRLRRSEMEGPALDRGDRQRLDVRRQQLHGRSRAVASSFKSSRRFKPKCARGHIWWHSSSRRRSCRCV